MIFGNSPESPDVFTWHASLDTWPQFYVGQPRRKGNLFPLRLLCVWQAQGKRDLIACWQGEKTAMTEKLVLAILIGVTVLAVMIFGWGYLALSLSFAVGWSLRGWMYSPKSFSGRRCPYCGNEEWVTGDFPPACSKCHRVIER
jgi:hypothetical protein